MVRRDLLPPSLAKDEAGIWRCGARSAVSYPEGGLSCYHGVEDKSFWFRHRVQCAVATMRRLPPGGLVLDVGGGTGHLARGLQDAGFEVIMVEADVTGALAARQRGVEVICATFQDIGFGASTVPAIGLFDVLEHIENDLDLLVQLHHVLVPNGRIYLMVPAYNFLFSHEDSLLGHFRRYNFRSLSRVLAAAGFVVEYESYLFMLLPLPIFILRTIPSWFRPNQGTSLAKSGEAHSDGGIAGPILDRVLNWEVRVIARGRRLPFGSSCLMVARKPQ